MQNIKDNVHKKIIEAGRELVRQKGVDMLTARKLSEASGCSIGAIYNQFGGMDDFIAEQNEITLFQLLKKLENAQYTSDSYKNLSLMADVFADFVNSNRELWSLLYNFHLSRHGYKLSFNYKRLLCRLVSFAERDLKILFPGLKGLGFRIMRDTFMLGLLSISSILTTDILEGMKNISKDNLCKIFCNTFWSGISVLKKE
ncbi:MAG: TetR/AcrR family transcriptional regulator [Alphaproteobacteria bacterium]|nr:TetR/AcrR family transcriptional regulator [Alphaproteobacteria bacterium]